MWVGDIVEIGTRTRTRIRSVHLDEGRASYAVEKGPKRITRYDAVLVAIAREPFRTARFTFADGSRLDIDVARRQEQKLLKDLAWTLMDYQGRPPIGHAGGTMRSLEANSSLIRPGFAIAMRLILDQIGEGDASRPFAMTLS